MEYTPHLIRKVIDAFAVPCHSIVGVVPPQFPGGCFHDLGSWQGTVLLYPLLVELQFCGNPLADAFASDLKGLATS